MEKIKLNFSKICRLFFKMYGVVFSVISYVFIFINWDYFMIKKIQIRIIIFIIISILLFIISFIVVLFFMKYTRIWSNGKNKVGAMYADIFKLASCKFCKKSRIIVIPVNDTFETIVETSGEGVVKPLVSPNSIHGKWINNYCDENQITKQDLNNRIQSDLKSRQYKPIKKYSKKQKIKGNLDSYEIGTTAIIDGLNNTKYYLLVNSTFDKNNNANSTKRQIRDSVDSLLTFYDKNGQSDPIYIPLMGTGMSRANLTHKQSLKVIKSCVLTSDKPIVGNLNIVVYNGDKDKVSIFD